MASVVGSSLRRNSHIGIFKNSGHEYIYDNKLVARKLFTYPWREVAVMPVMNEKAAYRTR